MDNGDKFSSDRTTQYSYTHKICKLFLMIFNERYIIIMNLPSKFNRYHEVSTEFIFLSTYSFNHYLLYYIVTLKSLKSE